MAKNKKENDLSEVVRSLYIIPHHELFTDSLLLDSSTEVIYGKYKSLSVSIRVCGNVRIVWKDSAYRNVNQFPKELIEAIRNNKLDDSPNAYVDDKNWYEAFVEDGHGRNIFCDVLDIDLSTITPDQARELIVELAMTAIENYLDSEQPIIDELSGKLSQLRFDIIKAIVDLMHNKKRKKVDLSDECSTPPALNSPSQNDEEVFVVDRVTVCNPRKWEGYHSPDDKSFVPEMVSVEASNVYANKTFNVNELSTDVLLDIYECLTKNIA